MKRKSIAKPGKGIIANRIAASTDTASKIMNTIKDYHGDTNIAMLGDSVVELAAYEMDYYEWAKLTDVVKYIEENDMDPSDIGDVADAVSETSSKSVGAHHAFELPDMIETVKAVRRKYAGTDDPIYHPDEYNLGDDDYYDDEW